MSGHHKRVDANQPAIVEAYKTCPVCNVSFRVKPSHYNKKTYCSRLCMSIGYKNSLTGKNNPNYKSSGVKVCPTCKTSFVSYNKKRRYCSMDCYNKSPERSLNAHKANDGNRLNKTCKACGVSIKSNRKLCDMCKPKPINSKCSTCGMQVNSKYDVKFCKNCRNNGLHKKQHISICGICQTEIPKRDRKYCDSCWSFVSKMKRGTPRKVDANQQDIIDALHKEGCSVMDLSWVGGGVPDLIVAKNGINYLIEIKNPKAKGKLNNLQKQWHQLWRGQVAIVESIDDALSLLEKNQ